MKNCLLLLLFSLFFRVAQPVYGAESRHWNVGDTVMREIDGKSYRFRCIDQNYADHMDFHRKGVLFLCDEVIPANTGSRYEFESTGDRPHDYVYYPGPIVCFGDSADYKYSAVRKWLSRSADHFADAEMVNTGVERGYLGHTDAGLWERFPGDELSAQYLGNQKMEDQLFILSVDEAYRYRNWLWKFGSVTKRNPETQVSEFCKGYWLRTPCGKADGSQVYIVDLVQGNIRPEAVRADQQGTAQEVDEETRVTGTTGVRPVFVLPQRQSGTKRVCEGTEQLQNIRGMYGEEKRKKDLQKETDSIGYGRNASCAVAGGASGGLCHGGNDQCAVTERELRGYPGYSEQFDCVPDGDR